MKIQTYFKDLDAIIGGLECPSLVGIGARTGMGKTSFLLNLCLNFEKNGVEYAFVSFEMTKDQIHKKTNNKLKLNNFLGSSLCAVELICHAIRAFRNTSKILIIDYLQLLTTGKYGDSYEEVSEIMSKLKRCSLENGVCIIFTSQLSRKVEERQGHRPMFSDFRDSGAIEEHSDLIMFLLRRDYYDHNDRPGLAEIIIPKNRFGEVGSIRMNFDKSNGIFSDYVPEKRLLSEDDEQAFSVFTP